LRFNEKKDSLFDHAGNYFLLTELFRGMYVVLEQFFRPPYVHAPPGANAESLE
jgi:NADH dehydrogenase (ubiquinone) Fe-S protein 8